MSLLCDKIARQFPQSNQHLNTRFSGQFYKNIIEPVKTSEYLTLFANLTRTTGPSLSH